HYGAVALGLVSGIGPCNEKRTVFDHYERVRWGEVAARRRLFPSERGVVGRQFIHVLHWLVLYRGRYLQGRVRSQSAHAFSTQSSVFQRKGYRRGSLGYL